MLKVIIMQAPWTSLIAPDVLLRRTSKFTLAFWVEDCFLSFSIEKSEAIKSNFDVQPLKSNIRKNNIQ